VTNEISGGWGPNRVGKSGGDGDQDIRSRFDKAMQSEADNQRAGGDSGYADRMSALRVREGGGSGGGRIEDAEAVAPVVVKLVAAVVAPVAVK